MIADAESVISRNKPMSRSHFGRNPWDVTY